jgi:hypothetical protein
MRPPDLVAPVAALVGAIGVLLALEVRPEHVLSLVVIALVGLIFLLVAQS